MKLALALLTACSAADTAFELTPVGPTSWPAQVAEAAQLWDDTGCADFAIGAGLPVRLYSESEWPGADNERGLYTSSEIKVRATRVDIERATLVHELGHALGLQHSDDPASVMWPIVGLRFVPTPADIENACNR